MALLIAVILFAAYVLDVVLGASSGASLFNDVQEMLVLFGATIAFVVAILRREKQAKND